MAQDMPGQRPAHPPEWQTDLNPNNLAGQNTGAGGPRAEKNMLNANDLKEAHRLLPDWTDDELKQLPVIPEGSRLEQGATYVDLRDPARRAFTATAGMVAGRHSYCVPKSEVDYMLWNRLIGVEDPARLDQAEQSRH